MPNALGGDFSSFERDSKDLAEEIARKKNGGGGDGGEPPWDEPDMDVMRLHRRPPPPFPTTVFGEAFGQWIGNAANAAACRSYPALL